MSKREMRGGISGPLRMASGWPVRKLRVGGLVGLGAALLLPLINGALGQLGLPAVGIEDLQVAWDLGLAVYGAVAAAVAWIAAYLARPGRGDVPVHDYEAERRQREAHREGSPYGRVGW